MRRRRDVGGVVVLRPRAGPPKEHVAVERGLVAADLAAATRGRARSPATLARLGRVVALQDAALQSFLAFAPRRFVTSYAKHAALPCVHDAVGLRTALSEARGGGEPDHARWFAVQSCRIDSLQAMMDDLQTAVHASALASQRSGLWRLLYLGVPLVAILLAGASLGLEALGGFIKYQESVAEKIHRLKSSQRKYKRLLLAWAPLSAWLSALDDSRSGREDG